MLNKVQLECSRRRVEVSLLVLLQTQTRLMTSPLITHRRSIHVFDGGGGKWFPLNNCLRHHKQELMDHQGKRCCGDVSASIDRPNSASQSEHDRPRRAVDLLLLLFKKWSRFYLGDKQLAVSQATQHLEEERRPDVTAAAEVSHLRSLVSPNKRF